MKITTNFADPAQQAVKPLLALSGLAAGALLLLGVWLIHDTLALRAELPELRQRAARAQAAGQGAPAQTQAAQRELERTRARVAQLNAFAQTSGGASAAVLDELEALLPPQAWLTRLDYRAGDGVLNLVAAAPSAELLSAFLLKLERSALFEQAMLLREVQPTGAGRLAVQFEIRLKVRS